MRRRIADEHPAPARPGICATGAAASIDLEFIVQYLMLREAARTPQVLRRDTGAALAALGRGRRAAAAGGAASSARRSRCCAHVRALLTLLFEGAPRAGSAGRPGRRDPGALRRRD